MNVRNGEKGAVIVIAAIALPVLLAGLGLVIDNGQAFDMKRRLQKGADAGAIAAAQEMKRGKTSDFYEVVAHNAELNGVDLSDATVEVFNPPKTGKRAGDPQFVEVEVRRESPLHFMKAFYDAPLMVEARAVAGVLPRQTCVIALSSSASPALLVSGSANVNMGVCGVHANSASNTSARSNGGATLTAANIDVVGDYTGTGFTPQPLTGVEAVEDPLADLPEPPIGSCTYEESLKIQSAVTLNPGVYCGGIEVTALGAATLNKGIYVLKGGGLTVRGGGTIKGDEVMFYNTTSPYAPIDFAGGAIAQLTAPLDGTYAGVLFYTDRTVKGGKANKLTGTSDSYFTGALYFPSTPLTFIGTTGMTVQKMLIIADTLEFQGNATVEAPSASDGLSPFTLRTALVH